MHNFTIKPSVVLSAIAALALGLCVAGCAGQPPNAQDDAIGTATQAFGTDCLGDTSVTFNYCTSGAWTSTATDYANSSCYKGVVLAVSDQTSSSPASVGYAGTIASSKTECDNEQVDVIEWKYNTTTMMYDEIGTGTVTGGSWDSGLGYCTPPSFTFSSSDDPNGHNYIFAVTARSGSTHSTTENFSFDDPC